jgi:hypothetical protein
MTQGFSKKYKDKINRQKEIKYLGLLIKHVRSDVLFKQSRKLSPFQTKLQSAMRVLSGRTVVFVVVLTRSIALLALNFSSRKRLC